MAQEDAEGTGAVSSESLKQKRARHGVWTSTIFANSPASLRRRRGLAARWHPRAEAAPGVVGTPLVERAREEACFGEPPKPTGQRPVLPGVATSPSRGIIALLAAFILVSCTTLDRRHQVIVSIPDQRMVLLEDGQPIATYPVSTSKFGLGDIPGTSATPLGNLAIARKIGSGAPSGAVFKDRQRTGEIVAPDAPGRDPIVTRILWLRGLESQNAHAFSRYIYIHGTPEERKIGLPASYGCIRMRSRDIVQLYELVGTGARVTIAAEPLEAMVPNLTPPATRTANAAAEPFQAVR